MSNFHRSHVGLKERPDGPDHPRSPFAEVAGRFASWITGMDRAEMAPPGEDEDPVSDPLQELIGPPTGDGDRDGGGDGDAGGGNGATGAERFPLAPFGYNRAAVDEHLLELEREIEELRIRHEPAMSITEELERIGEQTASILVVAHDKANETTRRAQEQAERCIAQAAASAAAITEEAQRRLQTLDTETDAVWRERERLLDDLRAVSAALVTLADEASERFPAADQPPITPYAAPRAPWMDGTEAMLELDGTEAMHDPDGMEAGFDPDGTEARFDPEATQSFPAPDGAVDEREASGPEPAGSGDTGSWLAGFEPPAEPDQNA